MMSRVAFVFVVFSWTLLAFSSDFLLADGPADNNPKTVRAVPPLGIDIDTEVSSRLLIRASDIRHRVEQLADLDDQSRSLITVFPRAVEITLETGMIYSERELADADLLLDEAELRISMAESGARGVNLLLRQSDALIQSDARRQIDAPGRSRLVVGGYHSRIDNSTQPYGLVIPASWTRTDETPLRLDVWLHGRGEKVSEVAFLKQRMSRVGEYAPENTVVLHPHGRYCNAFKFAGEMDVLEAIEDVKKLLQIDDTRITIRGFSMGGAGCWQMAVHYPDIWAAANPGAGFSETTEFLRVFQSEQFQPTWFQQKLLHWYDCPDWTNNLRNVPTVAYSGEIDRQKQAADIMATAFEQRGMKLTHVIGPQTAHKIHADSKITVQSLLDAHLSSGKPTTPQTIDLTTYSLRYHRLGWVSIEGLQEHWKESRVRGSIDGNAIRLTTSNLSRVSIDLPRSNELAAGNQLSLNVDGQSIDLGSSSIVDLKVQLALQGNGKWTIARSPSTSLAKRPGIQGPIDDAFMDAFTFVAPNPVANPGAVDEWVQQEYGHAKAEWRRHFRGDIVEVRCDQITDADIQNRNLILFGTPESNSVIAKIANQLPIKWTRSKAIVGEQEFASGDHVPLMIYPNPLNPDRYVVLNSGFTYREFAYLNNARQIPMLPDWAIVSITQGANSQYPGEIKAAGFFDEAWQLKAGPR